MFLSSGKALRLALPGTLCAAQAGLNLIFRGLLLPQPSKLWDDRCSPLYLPANFVQTHIRLNSVSKVTHDKATAELKRSEAEMHFAPITTDEKKIRILTVLRGDY